MFNQEAILEFIRGNKRICNMLAWEANEVKPRAWGPNLAVSHILDNPKRREKVEKELEKFSRSNGHVQTTLEGVGPGNPYFDGLAAAICDFRTEWELGNHA